MAGSLFTNNRGHTAMTNQHALQPTFDAVRVPSKAAFNNDAPELWDFMRCHDLAWRVSGQTPHTATKITVKGTIKSPMDIIARTGDWLTWNNANEALQLWTDRAFHQEFVLVPSGTNGRALYTRDVIRGAVDPYRVGAKPPEGPIHVSKSKSAEEIKASGVYDQVDEDRLLRAKLMMLDEATPLTQEQYEYDRAIIEKSLTFSAALGWLKVGFKVTRKGWNGKGMYIKLQRPDANSKMSLPYIYVATVQGDLVPWLASQTDILANDWERVA